LALFLLRGVFYCALFPLWEGFDEYSHFAFVQHVAEMGSLPLAAQTRVSREIEESLKLVPLPWLLRDLPPPHLTHDAYWRLPEQERSRRQDELRSMPADWSRQPAGRELLIYEAQQPPLYYWLLAPALRLASNMALPARVMFLRLLSMLLASISIPLAFFAAERVFGDRRIAVGITALIAVMPELMVDVCRVGNDSLGLLVYSLLIYQILRFIDDPGRRPAAILLGLILGLGLLTKAYFLTGVAALCAILACTVLFNRRSCKNAVAHGILALGLAALTSGWWYWRNRALTETWSGLMQDVELRKVSPVDLFRNIPRVDWRAAFDSTFFSHIWFGNWSFLQVRSWIYHSYRDLALLSLLGILILIAASWLKQCARFTFVARRDYLLPIILIYASFWLGLSYHILITFTASGSSSSAGWYLYGVIVAEILVFAAGLFALLPARLRPWILPVTTASFALLDLYTVHFLFVPYYAGLIAHRTNGALAAFVATSVRREDLWSIFSRLVANKYPLNVPLLLVIWAFYLGATVALVVMSFRPESKRRQ
jgi:4-amino-4-deoxy-L-arabinose transferase-like glycosyltransferase